ncbi:ATP-grasp domain-containing protein [Microbacterium sp. NPDC089987]|uniref:D-alanine--D-alanine ligase family protein n=1 Tax=Microbacterium sp. NPDC089987 TaxID=3364202 RepID=UPI00380716FB
MSRVIVLSGGESTEHQVSLASGADVAESLATQHPVMPIRIDRAGMWWMEGVNTAFTASDILDELEPDDVVFPVLHGGWGENGGLQHELETRGIRYVGCSAAACRVGMSKLATARAAVRGGVPTIPTRVLRRSSYLADPDLHAAALARVADWPLIVKPDAGGSSVGVAVVSSLRELRAALDVAFELDPVVLLQPLIRGAEVSVGVWNGSEHALRATGGSLVHLPEGETAFSYDHKYSGAGGWLEIPATFPAPILHDLQAAALSVAEAVGVAGLARIDFFVTAEGVVLNEINTMPGLRRESHFPRLVSAAGTSYDELLDGLVRRAARASGRSADDRWTGPGIRTARTIGA